MKFLGRLFLLVFVAAAIGTTGCGSAEDADKPYLPPPPPQLRLWEMPRVEPPRASFINRLPVLADVSTWAGQIHYRQRPLPTRAAMPYMGTGNGSVCFLMGTTTPLTTIHGLLGPTYQKGDIQGFFPDVVFGLTKEGIPVAFEDETIWRVRKTAVLMTRSSGPLLEMWTVCFAPFPRAWPGSPSPEDQVAFVLVYVNNKDSITYQDLAVTARLAWRGTLDGQILTTAAEHRRLRIMALGTPAHGRGDTLMVPLTLEPYQEKTVTFALVTSSPRFPEAPVLRSLEEVDTFTVEAKLLESIRRWRTWYGQGVDLVTPDARVNDLFEGLVITNKVSTTITGAPVEISHYSLVWNRDTYGPMRLFAATGRIAEARTLLDYHFVAVRHRGGLANAYPADLEASSAPPAPTAEDWARQGVFQGRIAAEGPSYLVLNYLLYLLLRGDLRDFDREDLSARMDMLRACVYQQAVSPEGLLPFSGDETFRPQMAISFGLGVEYPFETTTWSFASGVLLVAAAEALARLEREAGIILGEDASERVARAKALAERIRAATNTYFWNESGGYFEPYLFKEGNVPAGAPYGDVAVVPFWLNVDFQGISRETVASTLVERLFSRHKVFFSPADPLLHAVLKRLIGEGIYTGMTPGYTLWTLASVHHPYAEHTFNVMDDHADPGGNYPEVVVHDDTSPLTPVYDPFGFLGEMWARFRSWEGGINGEAILYYLSGCSADAQRNRIYVCPRLPNGWGYCTVAGVRIGQRRLDMHVERVDSTAIEVIMTLNGDAPLLALIELPGPPVVAAELDGRPLTIGKRLGMQWGGTATEIGAVLLRPGANRLSVRFGSELP